MVTIHLIHGFVGSGKTTFAKKLENELKAIRFTHDEFMNVLYGSNPPVEFFEIYYERVSKLIWGLAESVLQNNLDVILDFGFWTKESRKEALKKAELLKVSAKLYYVKCTETTMLNRTIKRTNNLPGDSLFITEETFWALKNRFEPLCDDEIGVVIEND